MILNSKLWALTRSGDLTARRVVSDCALSLAHEHHASICILLQSTNFASATALLRPVLEATVTSIWATYCATQGQLENLIARRIDLPKLASMIAKVDRAHPGVFGLGLIFKADGKIFHDMTHGGVEQLRRRMAPAGTPYTKDENELTLCLADVFLLLAMSVHAAWFEDEELNCLLRDETNNLIPAMIARFATREVGPWTGWQRLPPPAWNGAEPILRPIK